MQVLLWLFVINLAAAAVSRYPWKRQHIGFLITHLGIITLLIGSFITQVKGVDGVLALSVGERGRMLRLDENMLYVFRAVPGKTYELALQKQLDFNLLKDMDHPASFTTAKEFGSVPVDVLRYYVNAKRTLRVEDIAKGGVPAFKYRILGSRANFQDWVFTQTDTPETRRDLGPALLRFMQGKPNFSNQEAKPTLVLFGDGNPNLPPRLAVAKKGEKLKDFGRVQIGKKYVLGWMDFEFYLDEYHPSAVPKAEFSPQPVNPANSNPAIEVSLAGDPIWLELGSSGQVAKGDAIYYIQYGKRQVDIKFDVELKKFEIGYYEGTNRPKSYASEVEVMGKPYRISMNEPLHEGGFTLYQASYETDDDGKPQVSVLSVNYDPGRAIKYFGSIMMVLGIISMFYFKPQYSGTSKWLKKKETA